MDVFPYSPDYGAAPSMEPRRRSIRFGDGYDQRAGDGLNPFLATWGLTFSVRSESEARGIFGWLNGKSAHTTAFLWAVPGDSTATDEVFGTGDGSRTQWQLTSSGISVLDLNGTPTIYRTDWQGKVALYPWQRTNLSKYSEQFDNVAWSKVNGGTGVAPTVTANQYTAPDGTVTADQIQMNKGAGTGSSDQSGVTQGISGLTVGQQYTFSGWIKAQTGSPVVQVRIFGTVLAVTVAGNNWQRFTLTATATGTTDNIYVWLRGGEGTSNTADLSIWGVQMETGTMPTAYIQTTSAAATVTDYTLSGTGLVTLATAPVTGSILTWTGSYYRRFVADKWTPPKPDTYGSWSLQAEFRQVPA